MRCVKVLDASPDNLPRRQSHRIGDDAAYTFVIEVRQCIRIWKGAMIMDSTYFLRQLDIADPTKFKDKPVTVIGTGGIGAATVVALAKTGFQNITVYYFDTVEEHN
jgi:hypothetical protein